MTISKPKDKQNSKADNIIFGMGIMLLLFFITKTILMFGNNSVCDIILSKDYTVENIPESTIKVKPGLIEYEQYGKTRILAVDTYAIICK